MADSKKYDGSQWEHSLRKLTTATEAVENPLYSDGTAITSYTIKGNTAQNGIPTPSNPVDVNGVGERTINLLNPYSKTTNQGGAERFGGEFPAGTYYIYNGFNENIYYRDGVSTMTSITVSKNGGSAIVTATDTLVVWHSAEAPTNKIMVVESSEAKPYEPYGYKIPILSGGVTTNIYLGSTQTVRQIKKLVLNGTENWTLSSYPNTFYTADFTDYLRKLDTNLSLCSHYRTIGQVQGASFITDGVLSWFGRISASRLYIGDVRFSTAAELQTYLGQQYAAGTPVTIWYVLATPETATVNEPLQKIGDYADTLSNATAIPTTEGANSITVDTTVQPSEFTATWTGWHDVTVKEWDGLDWQ